MEVYQGKTTRRKAKTQRAGGLTTYWGPPPTKRAQEFPGPPAQRLNELGFLEPL